MGNRTSKYHNQRVTRNGRIFDSKHEAGRYTELKLLERAGKITDLRCQVSFLLIPAQYDENHRCIERPCKYVADFTYRDENGTFIVEDAKGLKTDVYRLKKKLLLWKYGIRIRET